jgi:hypothetical protein
VVLSNLIKSKVLSGKGAPIFFLVILPSSIYAITDILLTLNYIYADSLFVQSLFFIMFLVLFVVYGFYPYTVSTIRYFEKRGYRDVVYEYSILKKLFILHYPLQLFCRYIRPTRFLAIYLPTNLLILVI